MNVNLMLRHADESNGVCVGQGDPDEFLESLREHGWYVDGVSHADPHSVTTQWVQDGFEVIVREEPND